MATQSLARLNRAFPVNACFAILLYMETDLMNDGEFDPDEWLPLKQVPGKFPGRPTIETVRDWCLRGRIAPQTGAKVFLKYARAGARIFVHPSAITQFIADMSAEEE